MVESTGAPVVVRLLSALVVLTALVLVGLLALVFYSHRQFSKTRAADAAGLAEQLTQRQSSLSRRLEARASASLDALERIDQTRRALGESQVTFSDEQLALAVQHLRIVAQELGLLLQHVLLTQSEIAQAMHPLPAQPDPPVGTGGSGAR